MFRTLLGFLAFFCLSVSLVQASENGSQPNTVYEYNNSNIYYGNSQGYEQANPEEFPIRTFIDPQTGDRVTQIRSSPKTIQQPAPLYIEPVIRP